MLDIGAGTGRAAAPLAQARPDCRFTGIELAPATWAIGRLLLRAVTPTSSGCAATSSSAD